STGTSWTSSGSSCSRSSTWWGGTDERSFGARGPGPHLSAGLRDAPHDDGPDDGGCVRGPGPSGEPRRDGDRLLQGHSRRPLLHARALQHEADVPGRDGGSLLAGDPDRTDPGGLLHARLAVRSGSLTVTAMLTLRGVSKSYDGRAVLSGIDLDAAAGKTTVLIGPSGCGKSTLLRLMIGLVRPDAGAVRFESPDVRPATLLLLRRRMGYVIQDGGLFPHLTAAGNILLMASYLGWDPARQRARLAELAELTQFPADGMGRYPVQLSGGQRQRVGPMRALPLDPDLLLFDEPLGALDPM